jgi:hypothetical protein
MLTTRFWQRKRETSQNNGDPTLWPLVCLYYKFYSRVTPDITPLIGNLAAPLESNSRATFRLAQLALPRGARSGHEKDCN